MQYVEFLVFFLDFSVLLPRQSHCCCIWYNKKKDELLHSCWYSWKITFIDKQTPVPVPQGYFFFHFIFSRLYTYS